MLPECLMNFCQIKCSVENYKREEAIQVHLKAVLKDFNIPKESWEQIAKPNRNVRSGKPELT